MSQPPERFRAFVAERVGEAVERGRREIGLDQLAPDPVTVRVA